MLPRNPSRKAGSLAASQPVWERGANRFVARNRGREWNPGVHPMLEADRHHCIDVSIVSNVVVAKRQLLDQLFAK